MYNSIQDLVSQAEERGAGLWKIVLENEIKLSELDETSIYKKLDERYDVMIRSAERALGQSLPAIGGLIEGIASRHARFAQQGGGLMGGFLNQLMARAFSCSEVNASMGKICAVPTAGACGVLPAVLLTVGEKYTLGRREILEALLTASGVGAVITKNATVSGAEGGCQAECGAAAAMAAAAAVQMAGGTIHMSADACGFALMNCMGLICDPVAGLVQLPCALRNASQAVNALVSADMALAGLTSVIPPDEVIEAMFHTGRMLPPALKETALGGIAAAEAGKRIQAEIFSENP
ncbi:MAG: L-serine ammonia-lyase, iron-sulfur-dependent, subunit alpha [Clostridiales bacterium]|jgi:L-serine dehydratase|nr:L-serine ammonia-lyase, iron-sulfur-dependent, subunit alpha [Clostridiales bacterium]